MINYRERPMLRKMIIELLYEHPLVELQDLVYGSVLTGNTLFLTGELKIQAKKMLQEGFKRESLPKRPLYKIDP